MSVRSVARFAIVACVVVLGPLGCVFTGGQGGSGLLAPSVGADLGEVATSNSALVAPTLDATSFVPNIDNPYFPLAPGTVYSYREPTTVGIETVELEVTRDTKMILGVATTVIRDRVFLDGSLVEDTFDWYAQDREGNVWYFGEDVKDYKDGVLIGTAGSWEAGKAGAIAGIIMKAHPKVGDKYRQELAPGVAEDMASVLSLDNAVSVPHGRFEQCLKTMEFSPLAPGARALKYYAPGVGLVLELTPRGGRNRVELIGVSRR